MLVPGRDGVHLTYCSNIHPGESWAQTRHNLETHVPAVRQCLGTTAPFGIGLRLSAAAADELATTPGELQRLRTTLDDAGLYIFTINGFPYGPFHGTSVKEQVYRPDWREPERVRYTSRLIEILAHLLPPDTPGSISTVPAYFRARHEDGALETVAEALRGHAVELDRLRRERGVDIALALEPEPCCVLETVAETVAFFESHVFSQASIRGAAARGRLGEADAESALRRHIGVCLDTCHAAVEFEDPTACVDRLLAAGIVVGKAQLTTGLRLAPAEEDALEALRAFSDDVYLHQVVARDAAGALSRYPDLPDAFADANAPREEWRVHYHVPVFEHRLGEFTNTQPFLEQVLARLMEREATRHLEVETYTWDVLPPALRRTEVDEAIARELRWVLDRASR